MENEKIGSEIKSIELTTKSYEKSSKAHRTIEPTFVNFFFGNNGSGKTTIAEAIQSNTGVTWADYATDDKVMVFNQDFINRNVQSLANLPGVFTMGQANIELNNEINALEEKNTQDQEEVKRLRKFIADINTQKDNELSNLQDLVWAKTESLRKMFPSAKFPGSKKQLLTKIQETDPVEADTENLSQLYSSAFSSDETTYPKFRTIEQTDVLDTVEGLEILQKVVVNSAETDFARFLKSAGLTTWFKQSHSRFHSVTGGQCPYCGQELPQDFEETVIRSFDEQYEQDVREISSLLTLYRDRANNLNLSLTPPQLLLPGLDTSEFHELLGQFQNAIWKNEELIGQKTNNPAEKKEIIKTTDILKKLQESIRKLNARIDLHNNAINSRKNMQSQFAKVLMKHFSAICKEDVDAYTLHVAELDTQISPITTKIKAIETEIGNRSFNIQNLHGKAVETTSAMKNINNHLHAAGITGFYLVEHNSIEHSYRVVRLNGNNATGLSEGEKNIIAFLYFYYLVSGSDNSEGIGSGSKVVVIDDPVSSLDSGNLFMISNLIRDMVTICLNSADESLFPLETRRYIKQVFILTHNVYFHKAVTSGFEKYYSEVSFYLIRKENESSRIKLCVTSDVKAPTTQVNVNPVKNDYTLLWSTYKNTESTALLLSNMRRILEYYFIQLCGLDGLSLKERLFGTEEARSRFIVLNAETGEEDRDKLDIAMSLIDYVESASTMNNGIYYVDECYTPDQCREGFELVFECMDQMPHFKMMMENS